MKKLSKLVPFLSIVPLFCAMWLVHSILVFSFEASENKNGHYIPENATSVYRLDGRVLSRELLASLLISEDDDLRELAHNQIPTTRSGKVKPVGISFDSDIILFRSEEDGVRYSGMLFNLWDQRVFNRNIPKYLGDNSAMASTDGVGLVLIQLSGEVSKEQLSRKAKKILAKESYFLRLHPAPEEKSLISVWYQEDNSVITDVGVSVQDNQLLFKGLFETQTELNSEPLAHYKGGFHIHSQWLPESLKLRLQNELQPLGIDLPKLKQFSMNYYGAVIVTEPSIAGLPYLAGAFEFEDQVIADSLFKDFEVVSLDTTSNRKVYNILSVEYAITQKNERTIEVECLEKVELSKATFSSIAEISGSPKHLLKVDGDQFIKGILVFTNEYKSLSSFINEIQKLDIKMVPISGQKYRIQGKIALNDDKWPLNELLKFLIRSKLL